MGETLRSQRLWFIPPAWKLSAASKAGRQAFTVGPSQSAAAGRGSAWGGSPCHQTGPWLAASWSPGRLAGSRQDPCPPVAVSAGRGMDQGPGRPGSSQGRNPRGARRSSNLRGPASPVSPATPPGNHCNRPGGPWLASAGVRGPGTGTGTGAVGCQVASPLKKSKSGCALRSPGLSHLCILHFALHASRLTPHARSTRRDCSRPDRDSRNPTDDQHTTRARILCT